VDNEKTFKLSASIGIARFPDDAKKREDILAMADQMMYKAKKSGRGKVCIAGEIFD
jgi:diguanylate cyclase (GGDEF)-like protein